ncbi:MAG: hypothetical protein L6420_06980, partial [Elusimicrobia bacterium]|nr:hypothetical protein [Elusimicrobiota bacterium]
MRIVKLMPVAIILLSAGQLYASAPMRINFQGRLEESSEPVDGIKDFIFKIYDAESGGSLIWTSQSHSAMMTSGIFSIVLATGTPVNLSTATFAGPRYIEISVGGVVLNPRQEIVSAPYALVSQSLSADAKISLSNLEKDPSISSTINLTTNAVDWSQLKNVPIDFSDGVDNLGGGSIITKESGAIKVNPTGVLDFEGAQFNISDVGGGAAEISLEASSITLKGNTFNIAGKLLLLDGSGYVPDANLKSAIMVEGENVSLLANDANYLTSYSETDPLYIADEAYNITASSTTDWNNAFGWGDHASGGYLT